MFGPVLGDPGTDDGIQHTPLVAGGGILLAVAAGSARNAWAVSQSVNNTTVILRWNGTAWR
jgi:hypothetical protein